MKTELWTRLKTSRGFGRDFLLMLGTNLLLLSLGLFTGSLVARLLGPEGRGRLAAIQIWGLVLLGLGSLGVPNALVYHAGRRREDAATLIGSAWALMLPLSLVWIVLGYFLLPLLLNNQDATTIQFARLFLLILPLAYLSRAVWALQGLKCFGLLAAFRLHKPVVYACILILLGLLDLATASSVTLALLVSSVVGPPLALFLLGRHGLKPSKPSLAQMRRLLHYGIRDVLGTVPVDLNGRLDQMFMAIWLRPAELGLYVVAVSWSLLLGPIVRAVGSVAFPYVAGARRQEPRLRLFASSTRISLLVIVLVNTTLLLLTPLMLPLLFGDDYLAAVPVAMVLLLASSFLALKSVLSSGLRGLGYPEAIAYAELTGLLFTILLLILLLPRMGIMGAALASLIAYATSAAMLLFFSLRKTPLSLKQMLLISSDDIADLKRHLDVAPQVMRN